MLTALESYDRAYAIRPKNRDLAHERGDTLLELNRYEEAIASFDIFLRHVPDSDHVWSDRGYALYQLGRYDEALNVFDKILKYQNRNSDQYTQRQAYYFRIHSLCQLNRFEEALRSAQLATQRYPDTQTFNFSELLDYVREAIAQHLNNTDQDDGEMEPDKVKC